MPRKDLKHNIDVKEAIPSTSVAANGATVGNIIDTLGYESVTFVIKGETLTDGVYTPSIEEGNDPALADTAAAGTDYILDSYADSALQPTDDNKARTLGYTGMKRYVRLTLTASAVTSGGRVSANCVLGGPLDAPTATQGG